MGKVIEFRGKGEKKMAGIFDVANYFISKSTYEDCITPLKLQKLCFYAQAWNMVWEDKEIFSDEFQAWVHGPANYDLYMKYKNFGSDQINIVDEDYNEEVFTKSEKETLDAIWEAYGGYTGKYLEQLTHQEAPWLVIRGDLLPGQGSERIIPTKLMKEYYSSI